MADVVFNVARGRVRQRVLDGADLIIILLKQDEADDALRDHDTLADLLAAGGGSSNIEADFTNYARKTIANVDITATVDDTGNLASLSFPNQVYEAAGGATNNNLVSAIVCLDGASDAARIPVTKHDFIVATDGNDLTLRPAAGGFYRSKDD
jgi:acyl CoA:acetate/3-ketoacid CoA transferase beta subunit